MNFPFEIDPERDLVLERFVEVPRELVWKAWTDPAQLKEWFVPAPWSLADCRLDLRPGGEFFTLMRSPDGDEFPNAGCLLEIVENERLAFTSALQPGFRPPDRAIIEAGLPFTAIVMIGSEGAGTRYRAIAVHGDDAARDAHDEMGFVSGWAKALDQMVEMIKGAGE